MTREQTNIRARLLLRIGREGSVTLTGPDLPPAVRDAVEALQAAGTIRVERGDELLGVAENGTFDLTDRLTLTLAEQP